MPVTMSYYNGALASIVQRDVTADTLKIALYSSLTFDATDTTLAGITGTQVSGNGYTAGGATLSNVSIATANTNGVRIDADNVSWTASGGALAAVGAVIYNDTATGDVPLVHIDFGETLSAGDGTDFLVTFDAAGIIDITVS